MKKILRAVLAVTAALMMTQGVCVYADDISTDYGIIPSEYSDADAYPIAVFFSDRTFWQAYSDWDSAISRAIQTNDWGYGANILIRDDITVNTQYNNLEYMSHPLTIDLGGNTVDLAGGYLGRFANFTALNSLDITVKNGNVVLTQYSMFDNFQYYNDNGYAPNLNFENITFTYGSGAAITNPALSYTAYAAGSETVSETYTNCIFDFRANCPDNVTLFKLGEDANGTVVHNIAVKGCELLTDDMSKITVMQRNNEASSIVFTQYNDEYITISVPRNSLNLNLLTCIFPTPEGDMAVEFDSAGNGYDTYKLSPEINPNPPATARAAFSVSGTDLIYADQIKDGDVVSVWVDEITLPDGITDATYILSVRSGLELVGMAGKTLSNTDNWESGFELKLPPLAGNGQYKVYLMVIDNYQSCNPLSRYMSIE